MGQVVGYTRDSYAEQRNFLDLPFQNIKFKRKYDRFTLRRKLNELRSFQDWQTQFKHKSIPFNDNDVSGYHFFNTISVSTKPYIVTFETSVPRWKKNVKDGLKILERVNCKGLIGISDRALSFQKELITKHSNNSELLLSKLKKIPPAQKLFVDPNSIKRELGQTLNIIFIGNLFFLKGGYELLLAVDEMIKEGVKVNLTVISKIQTDNWFTNSHQELVDHVYALFEKNAAHITHYNSLENSDVLSLIPKHDVCFLPSFAETYGYSLLEAMAFGCPIVTTDVGAFNEINHSSRGWIISLKQNDLGQAVVKQSHSLAPFSPVLLNGIKSVINSIFEDKEGYGLKAQNAAKYIREYHNPSTIAQQYLEFYEKF